MFDKRLKKSQLAICLNVAHAVISMGIKRGYIIADAYGLIDLNHPANEAWINKQKDKGKTFDYNRLMKPAVVVESKPPVSIPVLENENITTVSKPSKSKQTDLYQKKIETEIKYKLSQIKKTEIEIRKREGELIPFDEAEFLLSYIVENVRAKFLQEAVSLSDRYKERFNITHDEYIDIKKDLTDSINDNYREAIEELKGGIDGIQDKYKEVRSRGRQ